MEQPFQDDSSQEEQTVSTEGNKGSPAVNVAAKNWKAGLAFGKVAPMPQKNWKKDFDQFAVKPMEKKQPHKKIQNENESKKEAKKAEKKELKRTPLKKSSVPLRKTPLAPIGKKKKERLKNEGSEVDVFLEVWNTREHICEVCGKEVKQAFMNGRLVKPQVFPHILSKGLYPQFRLLSDNIGIVCSIFCHDEFDKMHLDHGVRREFEEKFNIILSNKNQ